MWNVLNKKLSKVYLAKNYIVLSTYLFEVEQSLVQVQNERVLPPAIKRVHGRQVWRLDKLVSLVNLYS